ncbi:hypothetical protein Anapl_17034 [Anas platyrhynchos]|uniref:Uncharacterized protein n=1 Tax=Anas platyrhynchos TaxID=8839 RepID=R0L0I8_ANAPL|nr:hypothetical protein Anapl_17034 [Anas platyrhynchos]
MNNNLNYASGSNGAVNPLAERRPNEYSTYKADKHHSPGTVRDLGNCKDYKTKKSLTTEEQYSALQLLPRVGGSDLFQLKIIENRKRHVIKRPQPRGRLCCGCSRVRTPPCAEVPVPVRQKALQRVKPPACLLGKV